MDFIYAKNLSMAILDPTRFRLAGALLVSALLCSGCSGSSSSGAEDSDEIVDSSLGNTDNVGEDSSPDNTDNGGEQDLDTDSGVDDFPQAVEASLELLPVKTFRISWQSTPNAQTYRVLENPDGVSGFSDISGELDAASTQFDHYVALYSRVNAQYLVQSCNDQGCADSSPVMVAGTLVNSIGYFKASNSESADRFGSAVSLSADGNTLVVSAPEEDSAATGINGDQNDGSIMRSGAVYVFARVGDLWQQQAYLKASNTGESDLFGISVSLNADGNTLAVGAIFESSAASGINGDQNDNSAGGSGAVYVFVRSDGVWQQQAYVKASNSGGDSSGFGDRFGTAVSLSADGNTLAVGAPTEDSAATGINGDQTDNSADGSGAVYVFERSAGTWEQQVYLKASNTDEQDRFGESLSISADGNVLAVAAVFEDSSATGINGNQDDNSAVRSGAVYVFTQDVGVWQQQAYLKASNAEAADGFGDAISLSADGDTLAISAVSEGSMTTSVNGDQADNSAAFSGAVYVFVQSGGLWQQQAYLKANNAEAGDEFGDSISLSADGNTLAVTAGQEDSVATGLDGNQSDNSAPESGAAYVFVRSSTTWQQQTYLKASNTGSDIAYGDAVSLSADGNTLAIAASLEDGAATGINGDQSDNTAESSGPVYLY